LHFLMKFLQTADHKKTKFENSQLERDILVFRVY
jgi:hypothetical protein